ncbi:MAG: zinc ABC transporter substrate-binding protein, partial [Finegoldia magna]|nr:zinc ABC transporter substrate-binding protein [Finegoldia magna]
EEHDHDHDHEEKNHDHDHEEKNHDHDHEEKDHDHDHEHHHHGEFDPHIWMSPKQARIQMKNVYEAIVKFDAENKDFYEKNYKELDKKFEELDKKYAEVLAPQKDKYFIVPHEAFGYLARDYEINQVPIEGINSDSEPDLNKMKELTNFAKSHKINTVFYEMGESDKIANSLAKEINAKTAGLSTIEAKTQEIEDGKDNYFSLLEKNLDAISQAK